ncbi:DUF2336 domain-containing protein [Hoeflea sp. YIM 152468]|uniref:DUF2336 domain-containing protein n=1 Tax=Hoeflea sp. YIM 152468 TaxID=3031759 RepID=UPI0023DC2BFA|nr:DUF2336 domain-containing protein [Hoeflea sp. YIM 152468]MDF1607293.1 DUF2336 domain-containing protein [Hoeflea sp. YIM 152468]
MSNNFRDLERPDAARRKDAVLMAAISGLECLDKPSRQDLVRFSRLFLPLYMAASADTQRTASATLSRLSRVPDDVADMLINQPIAIAAPFIVHYPLLRESALIRAVMANGAPHARAAARRSDLSPQAIAALRDLKDPSVDGLLVLRGLIPQSALDAAEQPAPDHAVAERPTVDAPPLDPSEKLRSQLRAMASRSPAPDSPLSRPTGSGHQSGAADAPQPALPGVSAATDPAGPSSAERRVADVRLAQLARHAKIDQESWFATALADAMGTSYALAERIMMDLSGRQLATALIGLGAPESTIRSALESFFPHLAKASTRYTRATDLIEQLDSDSCSARLKVWQRADRYTNSTPTHVPALSDGKPVRQASGQRAAPQDIRRKLSPSRKTG